MELRIVRLPLGTRFSSYGTGRDADGGEIVASPESPDYAGAATVYSLYTGTPTLRCPLVQRRAGRRAGPGAGLRARHAWTQLVKHGTHSTP